MSVNDIMNYVSQTPGNTNPSVIKSMVEREIEKTQNIKAMLIESADDVDYELSLGEETWYHIGTYVPSVEEMQSAVLIVNDADGSGGAIRAGAFTIEDVSVEAGGTFYQLYNGSGIHMKVFIMVCGMDIPDEGIKAGTYINSNYCMFPAVSGLIFGV